MAKKEYILSEENRQKVLKEMKKRYSNPVIIGIYETKEEFIVEWATTLGGKEKIAKFHKDKILG